MKHLCAACILLLIAVGLESQPAPCLAVIPNPAYRGNQIRACNPILYRSFVDQVPVLQPDGSYLITNPMGVGTPDSATVECFANGLRQSTVGDAIQSPDYSLDPANPLHLLLPVSSPWPLQALRCNFTLTVNFTGYGNN